MQIEQHSGHLTYCSNIHPGETWKETFENIKKYTTQVGRAMTPDMFGIGLRLSNLASLELMSDGHLADLAAWLEQSGHYVFTINGFPYGGFHGQVVKDKVHHPDWTMPERLEYTKRLFDILAVLLPEGMDGGVSTAPISYQYWHQDEMALNRVKSKAAEHFAQLLLHLHQIKLDTGKILHLDLEPEPDGVLETSSQFIDFFKEYLLRQTAQNICSQIGCHLDMAEQIVRTHFQLCYDVCHFAVGFEPATTVLDKVAKAGINIGRIQVSAAMSTGLLLNKQDHADVARELAKFDEPTYLHQAVLRSREGRLKRFRDLGPALKAWPFASGQELRTHFHVPVFTQRYGHLISTQQDIREVLAYWKTNNFTNHLEVETYTWDVLPEDLRTDIVPSIIRELKWVIDCLHS